MDSAPSYEDTQPISSGDQAPAYEDTSPMNAPPLDKSGRVALSPSQTFQQDASYDPQATNPTGQRFLQNAATAAGGYSMGKLGGAILGKGASLLSSTPTLADAGIKGGTILKMTPRGVNPAQTVSDLQSTLNASGGIGSDAVDTWNKVNALKDEAGQAVGAARDAIRQNATSLGGEDPSLVDADKALKPILDGWTERASNATGIGRSYAQPFEDAHNSLSQVAQSKGGSLTMDDIKKIMDQVGPLTHKGAPEQQEAMSQLYGALADAHDGIVQSVAKAAKNPTLAQNLLDANAKYSKFIRILPDIARSAAQMSLKASPTIAQRVGPFAMQTAANLLGGAGVYEVGKKFFGNSQNSQ